MKNSALKDYFNHKFSAGNPLGGEVATVMVVRFGVKL